MKLKFNDFTERMILVGEKLFSKPRQRKQLHSATIFNRIEKMDHSRSLTSVFGDKGKYLS